MRKTWMALMILLTGALAFDGCAFLPQKAQATEWQEEETDAPTASFLDTPSAIEEAAASVVRLEVYNEKDERIGSGSGFCAFDPEILVTAAHVIVNMDYMIAWRDDGTTFRVESVLGADKETDLALCRLPEDAMLPPLAVASDPSLRGEDILAIGSQFGLTNLVSKGTLCGFWDTEELSWILFTAPVSPGCSGGPLFNQEGLVIGVIAGSYEKGQNINLASPVGLAEGLR